MFSDFIFDFEHLSVFSDFIPYPENISTAYIWRYSEHICLQFYAIQRLEKLIIILRFINIVIIVGLVTDLWYIIFRGWTPIA